MRKELSRYWPMGLCFRASECDTYRKKQDFVIGRKFAQVASDADVELMARLKRVNSEHEWQLKQNIKSMDHLYKKYKIRSKKGVEEGVESTNEAKLSKDQLAVLKYAYKDIKTINPSEPAYDRLVKHLDSLSKDELKQLADAGINFISLLAKRRLMR